MKHCSTLILLLCFSFLVFDINKLSAQSCATSSCSNGNNCGAFASNPTSTDPATRGSSGNWQWRVWGLRGNGRGISEQNGLEVRGYYHVNSIDMIQNWGTNCPINNGGLGWTWFCNVGSGNRVGDGDGDGFCGSNSFSTSARRYGFPSGLYQFQCDADDEMRIFINCNSNGCSGQVYDQSGCCGDFSVVRNNSGSGYALNSTSYIIVNHREASGGARSRFQLEPLNVQNFSGGSISGPSSAVCGGEQITLNNTQSGSVGYGSLLYKWYIESPLNSGNWSVISGATAASLTTTAPSPGSATTYRYLRRTYPGGNVSGEAYSEHVGGKYYFDATWNVTVNPRPTAPQAVGNISLGAVPAASVGANTLIANGSITASSSYACGGCVDPHLGRLFNKTSAGQAWAAQNGYVLGSEWWQVDLGSIKPVNGIATQARGDCCSQRVLTYTVRISVDGSNWFDIPGTFNGNTDDNTVVTNMFGQYHARYVRIVPQSVNNFMSMRAEVISMPEGIPGSTHTLTFSADIVASANTVRWYDAPSGGTLLGTGQVLTLTGQTANRTVYAAAYNSTTGCESTTRTAVTARINFIYGYGPGGVGNNAGNSELSLWINPDYYGVQNALQTASDLSGSGNNGTQADASKRPNVIQNSDMNWRLRIRFDGVNDILKTGDFINNTQRGYYADNAINPYQTFAVTKYNGTNGRVVSSNSNNWLMGNWGNKVNACYTEGWVSNPSNPCNQPGFGGGTVSTNNPQIVSNEGNRVMTTFRRNATQEWQNGCGLWHPRGIALGGWGYNETELSNADVGEVIAYNLPLNSVRINILDNYLASKFDISINASVAALYSGNTSANGDCDFDVIGIGRATDGIHESGVSWGFRVINAGFLQNNGDYIIVGRNATWGGWDISNLPTCGGTNPSRRLSRIWYLHKTDVGSNGGNITLTFNLGELGNGTPVAGTYHLLYRSSNSGDFSTQTTTTTVSGNTVSFTVNANTLNNGQYTLGYREDIPRAIRLTNTGNDIPASPQYLESVERAWPLDFGTGDFTYEFWVRPAGFTDAGGVNPAYSGSFYDAYFENGVGRILMRQENSNTIGVFFNDGTNWYSVGFNYIPPVNEWTHLALVRSSGQLSLIVNGVQVGSSQTFAHNITSTSTHRLRIGNTFHSTWQVFNGQFDEFRAWNIALTPAQIQAKMHERITNADPHYWNLMVYYRMNESGGQVFDYSWQAINLTRINNPTIVALHPATVSISGPDTICINSSATYTVNATNQNSRLVYTWTINGGNIVSGQGTSQITVNWTQSGNRSISVTVRHSNECYEESATRSVTVTFNINNINNVVTPAIAVGDYIWTGNDGPDWLSAGSWYEVTGTNTMIIPGSAPSASKNVYILPKSLTNNCISNNEPSVVLPSDVVNAKNVIIWTGANLHNKGTMNVHGNFKNLGSASGNTLAFKGNSPQTLQTGLGTQTTPVAGKAFRYLVTDNSGNNNNNSITFVDNGYFIHKISVLDGSLTTPNAVTVHSRRAEVADDMKINTGGAVRLNDCNTPIGSIGSISGNHFNNLQRNVIYTYSIQPVTNTAIYTWNFPPGFIIHSGQGTTSVTVSLGCAAFSGDIEIIAENICGSVSTTAAVTTASSLQQPDPINGPTGPLACGSTYTYSTNPVTGASSYTWTVPNGFTILSGQGTTSIQILVTTSAQNGNITVGASGSCGQVSPTRSLGVTVTPIPATPGSITGPTTNLCSNTSYTYSISNVNYATSYNWSVPSGWTITNNNGTSITVTSGTSGGTISVSASNSCGTSGNSSVSVSILPVPNQPGNISGCTLMAYNASGISYSISSVANATSYNWTVPSGASIVSGQGTTTITVNFSGTLGVANTGTISVTASNCNGSSAARNLSVTFGGKQIFSYTGNDQTWTATPCGISTIRVKLWGAGGGGGYGGGTKGSGAGAFVRGDLTNVSQNETFTIVVGKGGGVGIANAGVYGYGGGAPTFLNTSGWGDVNCGGQGGGRTAFKRNGVEIAIAGAGGGAGAGYSDANGGGGGATGIVNGTTGVAGANGQVSSGSCTTNGGQANGTGGSGSNGSGAGGSWNGSVGGNGGYGEQVSGNNNNGGGGGGSGYGGGAGGCRGTFNSAGGAGGSSYMNGFANVYGESGQNGNSSPPTAGGSSDSDYSSGTGNGWRGSGTPQAGGHGRAVILY